MPPKKKKNIIIEEQIPKATKQEKNVIKKTAKALTGVLAAAIAGYYLHNTLAKHPHFNKHGPGYKTLSLTEQGYPYEPEHPKTLSPSDLNPLTLTQQGYRRVQPRREGRLITLTQQGIKRIKQGIKRPSEQGIKWEIKRQRRL